MAKVSIIVPVYNSAKYLDECLDSLLRQTHRDIEAICIDDGSTDDSPQLLDSWATRDSRVKVIHQDNHGVSYSRNVGLDHAAGDFVMFVDSDDYICLQAVEILLNRLEEHAADIAVFGGKTFPTINWADASFASRDTYYAPSKSVDALLYEQGSAPLMCNKMYRRSLIESNHTRFNTELVLGEDNAFQFAVFPQASGIVFVRDLLYFYRGHDDSALHKVSDDHDSKITKHFQVVSYVVKTWDTARLLAQYGRQLLEWAIGFLYNDMRYASFNVRKEISALFYSLVRSYFTNEMIQALSDEVWTHFDFLLKSSTETADPLVTFVVSRGENGEYPLENLATITNQNEQRIRCIIDQRCATDAISDAVSKDERCSIMDLASVSQALDCIDTKYVIFTTCNCRYDVSAVGHLIDSLDAHGRALRNEDNRESMKKYKRGEYVRGADAMDADMVFFRDRSGFVRTEDPFFGITPSIDQPYSVHDVYSANDLRNRIYNVVSLCSGNKLFSLGFLRRCQEKGSFGANDPVSVVSLCAPKADSIVFCPLPLLKFGEMVPAFSSDDEPHFSTLALYRAYLNEVDDSYRFSFSAALAEYCFCLDDATFDYAHYPVVYQQITKTLELLEPIQSELVFSRDEDKNKVDRIQKSEPLEHFHEKMRESICREMKLYDDTLSELGESYGAINRLSEDIARFYESVSYRVGHAVTSPIRSVYYKLKTIRSLRH